MTVGVTSPDRTSGVVRAIGKLRDLPELLHGGIGYHRGPVLVNQLGYQVFRTVYKNVGWHLRRQPVTSTVHDYVAALDRDGCISIPDFLPQDDFARLRAEFDESRRSLPYAVNIVEDNGVQESTLDLGERRAAFPAVWSGLVENAVLRAIVAGALRRPISVRPRIWLKYWHKVSEVGARGPGHIVGANYVHADMHYPTFKAFFYLNDVDTTNGAFQFALGSHKMTLARVAYEYDASIRVARGRRRGRWENQSYAVVRKPTEAQAGRLGGLECTPMCGRANTIIIANTQGFHRQGEFAPSALREAAYLCFRSSEPGGASLVPNGY